MIGCGMTQHKSTSPTKLVIPEHLMPVSQVVPLVLVFPEVQWPPKVVQGMYFPGFNDQTHTLEHTVFLHLHIACKYIGLCPHVELIDIYINIYLHSKIFINCWQLISLSEEFAVVVYKRVLSICSLFQD